MQVAGRLVRPGDPVPEAEKWPNLRHYLSCRWVARVKDAPAPTPPVYDVVAMDAAGAPADEPHQTEERTHKRKRGRG
jgi:hypothetical protein